MQTDKHNSSAPSTMSIEEKLNALHELQHADSEIDKIQILRGELPLEVQDLEDEIEGLQTRMANYKTEIKDLEASVLARKNGIKDAKSLIEKYSAQQMKVRNNREYESLSKEVEYQNLEIQLAEKHIREFDVQRELKKNAIDEASVLLEERKKDLEHKKAELNAIVSETEKDETSMKQKSAQISKIIEPRLLNAYTRIRKNVRNGLAVVNISRGACGGCFNKIPPQRQLDIRSRKKIIVCEYCGRILVTPENEVEDQVLV